MPKKVVTKSAQEIAQEELNARLRDGLQDEIDATFRDIRHTTLKAKFPGLRFKISWTVEQEVPVIVSGSGVSTTTHPVGTPVELPDGFYDK